MDFSFTPDQEALRESVRDFLGAECTSEVIRRAAASADGFPKELWSKVSELGWPGLIVPEEHGGVGLGWIEAAILAEEMGRALFPGPFFSNLVVASALIAGGTEEQQRKHLPVIADGSVVATAAVFEGRGTSPGDIQMKARPADGGYVLDGTKLFVTDCAVASLFLVAVQGEVGTRLFLVEAGQPGVSMEDLPVVDRTRRQGALVLKDVAVTASSEVNCSLDDVLSKGDLFLAGELAGIARRCLEMSVEHAKTRHQFDKPIGVYQAVSHKIADMYVGAEHSSSLLYYAAWAASGEPATASLAAAQAKLWSGQAATRAALDAIQVHGGMGFTWEHDLHLFLKRAKANQVLLSDPRHLADSISSARYTSGSG